MDPFRSPSVGFTWGPSPAANDKTPLPQDPMEFINPEHLSGIEHAAPTGYAQRIERHPSHHNATPGPSNLRPESRLSDHDAIMIDLQVEAAQSRQRSITSRRSKHAELDWDGHREQLYQLYIQEGKLLTETITIMKQSYGFDAPPKAYKEKFKFWGWRRNLPGEVALWMVDRAAERKATGKRTEFEFGGQRWSLEQATSSANRTKKGVQEAVETPDGLNVVTPSSNTDHASLTGRVSRPAMEPPTSPSVIFVDDEVPLNNVILPLSYNGSSIQDLGTALIAARDYDRGDNKLMAEESYQNVFNGYQRILGPTHPDAVKVGYELATFYWQQDRKADADHTLEQMTAQHTSLGLEHKKTQQHLIHVAELLNSWDRGVDALAFLSHARELAEAYTEDDTSRGSKSRKQKGKARVEQNPSVIFSQRLLSQSSNNIAMNPSFANINHGLDNARLHATVNQPTVIVLLNAIESQCLKDPAGLAIQGIRARAELLKYHMKQGVTITNQAAFLSAPEVLQTFWTRMHWDRTAFKSHEAIEASLELTAGVLKGNFDIFASSMFREIDRKTSELFGLDDERTIWTFITIGIVYQTSRTWDEARSWFERAWAAAVSVWGPQDGITKSLEQSFDKRHFSYINDEGRPFKTIFGVCGFTIRPTRLHLE